SGTHAYTMRNSKVRPIIMSNCSDALNFQDNHGSWHRHGSEFWYARRAFLNSYHFSEENGDGFKEKLKRLVKELNKAAIKVVLDMRDGMSKRRLGIKVFRFTMTLPYLFLVTMRCFTPWFNKKELMS
ncbi:putative Transmembrane protein, partial [Quillaja saponaria]